MVFRWVPRERIVGADALSKVADAMDFGLERDVFAHVNRTYGPCDVDRFAAGHNRVCPRFNSKFDTDGSEAVDAFSVSWSRGVSYVLPDFYPSTLDRVLDKIERDNAAAVVVVPEWDYYPFWHHLWSASFQRRVVRHEWVAGHCLVAHPEHTAECFFHRRDRLSGRRLDEGRFMTRLLVFRTRPLALEGRGVRLPAAVGAASVSSSSSSLGLAIAAAAPAAAVAVSPSPGSETAAVAVGETQPEPEALSPHPHGSDRKSKLNTRRIKQRAAKRQRDQEQPPNEKPSTTRS